MYEGLKQLVHVAGTCHSAGAIFFLFPSRLSRCQGHALADARPTEVKHVIALTKTLLARIKSLADARPAELKHATSLTKTCVCQLN